MFIMFNFVSFKFAFQMFCIAVLTCPNTSSFTVKVRSRISVILLSFIHCKLWWNSSSRYSKSLKSHGLIARQEKNIWSCDSCQDDFLLNVWTNLLKIQHTTEVHSVLLTSKAVLQTLLKQFCNCLLCIAGLKAKSVAACIVCCQKTPLGLDFMRIFRMLCTS